MSALPGHLRFGCWFLPGITLLIVVLEALLPPLSRTVATTIARFLRRRYTTRFRAQRHYFLMRAVRRRTPLGRRCKWEGPSTPTVPVEAWHSLHLPTCFIPSFPTVSFRAVRSAPFLHPARLHRATTFYTATTTLDYQALSSLARDYDCPSTYTLQDQPSELDYLPIVIDTGASVTITPNPKDFTDGIQQTPLADLKGINSTTKVEGEGIIEWEVFDVEGVVRSIFTRAYYVPSASIRLFSPQSYFQEMSLGSGEMFTDRSKAVLRLHDGTPLTFPYNRAMNLPLMLPTSHRHSDEPTRCCSRTVGVTRQDVRLFGEDSEQVWLSVADEMNQNLTSAQKELLLLHWKLGHCNFQWVQALAATPRVDEEGNVRHPMLPTKVKSVSSCAPPLCATCQLAKQGRRGAGSSQEFKLEDRDMLLKRDNLFPGDCVSIDQYASTVLGRLAHTRGKEKETEKLNGGTIFVDHATGFIFLKNQVSLRSGETIQAKQAFEHFAMNHGVKIRQFRADNQPFSSQEFMDSIDSTYQTITFSGVGAKHQNGVAERAIRTVTQWARAMLLNSILHWPDSVNLELWPFALEHAVFLWNHIPRKDLRLSPLELFTGSRHDNTQLLTRLHVWGCPVYVLEPKLQDGNKIPKWDPRVRRGQFMGYSSKHSTTVGLILNMRTGSISPQFHCVYDDLFTTVPNADSGGLFDPNVFDATSWARLIESGVERVVDDDGEAPPLHLDWEPEGSPPRPAPRDLPRLPDTTPVPVTPPRPMVPTPILRPPTHGTPNRPPLVEVREGSPIVRGNRRVIFDDDPVVRRLPDEFEAEFDQNIPETPEFEPPNPDFDPEPDRHVRSPQPRRSARERRPNPKFRGEEWSNYQKGRPATQKVRMGALNEAYLQNLNWKHLRSKIGKL